MNFNQYIEAIIENPLYTAIAFLLGIILLWTILKKLVKAVVVLLVVAVACAAFLGYTGKEMPVTGRELIERGSEKIIILKNRGVSLLRDYLGDEEQEKTTQTPRQNKL